MSSDRIKLDMSLFDVLYALSGGNPGALTVCMSIMEKSSQIDPDGGGGILVLLNLDTLRIYEHRIWGLFKDVCKEDLTSMLAVLRAWQLGQLAGATDGAINHAIDHYGEGLDIDAILAAVRERLPKFAPAADEALSGAE